MIPPCTHVMNIVPLICTCRSPGQVMPSSIVATAFWGWDGIIMSLNKGLALNKGITPNFFQLQDLAFQVLAIETLEIKFNCKTWHSRPCQLNYIKYLNLIARFGIPGLSNSIIKFTGENLWIDKKEYYWYNEKPVLPAQEDPFVGALDCQPDIRKTAHQIIESRSWSQNL